ncbi:MAG TPA: hypothetical protein GX507_08890 [Clostridia bacterium]|nr:hypothetical protein [Clostridia bacterium]
MTDDPGHGLACEWTGCNLRKAEVTRANSFVVQSAGQMIDGPWFEYGEDEEG